MSTFKIKVANFFARESCAAWQPKRIIRIIYRHIYRFIMETGAEEYPYARKCTSHIAGTRRASACLYGSHGKSCDRIRMTVSTIVLRCMA